MKLTIEHYTDTIKILKADGKKLCFAINHGNLDETYKVALRRCNSVECVVVIGSGVCFHDSTDDNGIEVGLFAGDDFLIDGRAALAKLHNKVQSAIDNLETVTLEIA